MRNYFRVLKQYILDSDYRFGINSMFGMYNSMPDEEYLKRAFIVNMHYELDLDNPRTYNEKLQWLKLYNRNPIYTTMVDKVAVKDYVKSIIGEDYIIPTLGVYDKFNEIDFEKLPNSFVIKCAHDSGGIVICPNKENFDYTAAKKKIEKYQKRDFYLGWREWPYKNVPRRIIVEQYMEDKKTKELRDYKFFTFNGKVKALFIASDRQNPNEDTKFDFFDESYNHLPIINGHPNANTLPERPKNFELMKELAEKLAVGIPHVRVDFYEIDGKVYFGEMTFFHWSGVVPFEPKEWDLIFGDWIQLPNEKIIE